MLLSLIDLHNQKRAAISKERIQTALRQIMLYCGGELQIGTRKFHVISFGSRQICISGYYYPTGSIRGFRRASDIWV